MMDNARENRLREQRGKSKDWQLDSNEFHSQVYPTCDITELLRRIQVQVREYDNTSIIKSGTRRVQWGMPQVRES